MSTINFEQFYNKIKELNNKYNEININEIKYFVSLWFTSLNIYDKDLLGELLFLYKIK
jgi:lipopolysaccharide biosynthesis protein